MPSAVCRNSNGTRGGCRGATSLAAGVGSSLPALLCYLEMFKDSSTAAIHPSWYVLRSPGQACFVPSGYRGQKSEDFSPEKWQFSCLGQQREKSSEIFISGRRWKQGNHFLPSVILVWDKRRPLHQTLTYPFTRST